MKIKRFFRRGVVMVEYAVLLAFIISSAGLFTSDVSIAKGVDDVITRVTNIIGFGNNRGKLIANSNVYNLADVDSSVSRDYQIALSLQSGIIYEVLQRELGIDKQLIAAELGDGGTLANVWYIDNDNSIKAMEASLINSYNVWGDNNNNNSGSTLSQAYKQDWRNNTVDSELGVAKYYTAYGSSNGFIAYDKEGYVIKDATIYKDVDGYATATGKNNRTLSSFANTSSNISLKTRVDKTNNTSEYKDLTKFVYGDNGFSKN